VVSYAQELRGAAPYVLPLNGLPQIGAIDVTVTASGAGAPLAALREQDRRPDGDFVVDRASLSAGDGLRSGGLVLARVRPVGDRRPDPIASAIVLYDTSASRALGFAAQTRLLDELAARMAEASDGGRARLVVACFDQSVEEVYAGSARDLDAAAL